MKISKLPVLIMTFLFLTGISASYAVNFSLNNEDLQVLQEKSFKTEPGKRIKISGSTGDVLVTSWDKPEVYVKILGNKKAKEKIDFDFKQDGDLIEVIAKREGFFLWGSGISLRFEVKVPRKYNTNISTSGGDIRFAGVEGKNILKTSGGDVSVKETFGEMNLSTSGGDISLERVAGNFNTSTSGGNIKGSNIKGSLKASTSGGDIKLEAENSYISAETSGGDITLNYTGENKGIELATSGGDIRITLPATFDASAYLSTSGGDVDIKMKTGNVKKLSSTKFEGDINNGGKELVAKTSGGTITVNSK